jgi:hypothetical protein
VLAAKPDAPILSTIEDIVKYAKIGWIEERNPLLAVVHHLPPYGINLSLQEISQGRLKLMGNIPKTTAGPKSR